MLNQGRPLLRVERSGARTEKGAGWKRAHARGEVKVRGRFREGICQAWVHCFDGGCAGLGGGSFATASERSEHRWVWVGGEWVRRAGTRIMSGANTD